MQKGFLKFAEKSDLRDQKCNIRFHIRFEKSFGEFWHHSEAFNYENRFLCIKGGEKKDAERIFEKR